MSIKRKVLHKLKEAPDLEVHVNQVRIGAVEVIEIRNFVPSAKRYGRGVLLRPASFKELVEEIGPETLDRLWPRGVPGENQGVLALESS